MSETELKKAAAICPHCHCELPEVGALCSNDGWYGVSPTELARSDNDTILGYPIAGKFVPLKRVGQGGMGVVYKGRQIGLGRIVAIKILSQLQQSNEQIALRFQREAKSIARIVHQNVVQLIDSGFDHNIAYIIMEFVEGRELSSLKANELSGQLIAHIAHQILNALAEAHSRNVIHRDLKPDNIMLTNSDGDKYCVKVLDFGLAALTDNSKITFSGQALGTPWYMSPEQATASPVTTMTDIYSLGCILFELASGKPPYAGNRPYNVMMQHVNAEIPMLIPRPEIELSSEMLAFIRKCLQKEPKRRYQTALEALDALHQCPEWVAAGQFDPLHSISMVMKQLCEINDMRSDVIQSLTTVSSSSGEIAVISSRSARLAMDDVNRTANASEGAHSGQFVHPSREVLESDAFRPRAKSDSLSRPAASELTTSSRNSSENRVIELSDSSEQLRAVTKENKNTTSEQRMNSAELRPKKRETEQRNVQPEINAAKFESPYKKNLVFYLIIGTLCVLLVLLIFALHAVMN